MSIVKLIQIGNSVGVILTKELLARLDLEKSDIVFVTEAANGAVMLSPHSPEFESQMLAEHGGASSTCDAGRLVSALARPENLANDGACVLTKLAVAASDMSEDDFAAWMRAHLQAHQARRSVTVPLR